MRRLLRDNGLSIALIALFLIAIGGQALTGWMVQLDELRLHGQPAIGFLDYVTSGHFLSAAFENSESEFLQMSLYVLLTVFLFQRGSSESKKPDEPNPEDEPPEQRRSDPKAPWPVRRGGVMLKLYAHSLSIVLVTLFLLSFWFHLAASTQRLNEEAAQHGGSARSMGEILASAEFWFESFQNWQSEFLSMAVLIILGIFLREHGSSESKPVAAPHSHTGH